MHLRNASQKYYWMGQVDFQERNSSDDTHMVMPSFMGPSDIWTDILVIILHEGSAPLGDRENNELRYLLC
jgi:hypothetical protein